MDFSLSKKNIRSTARIWLSWAENVQQKKTGDLNVQNPCDIPLYILVV